MRLDDQEKKALRFALKEFKGKVYLFGSRVNEAKRGGDIDLLVIPDKKGNHLKLVLKIQTRFFSICEEKLDVIVYDDSLFCKEVLKHAERIIVERI
ncbi:MAG: nucleotidyltransferase domain-containing protein [Candidatus Omnitrophota bacterium]|nr:nucleotidyltransferase domain-containing protein [Candidatus Omnitrophota bacterium]